MTSRIVVALFLVLVCGCNTQKTLPHDFVGTYSSKPNGAALAPPPLPTPAGMPPGFDMTLPQLPPLIDPDELTVTEQGISMRSGSALHTPPVKFGQLSLPGDPSSDLFTSVKCSSSTSCNFKTKSKCEGTIEKQPQGGVTIVVSGLCASWAGTWNAQNVSGLK